MIDRQLWGAASRGPALALSSAAQHSAGKTWSSQLPRKPTARQKRTAKPARNERLRQELLAMRESDLRVRSKIIKGASIFADYDPRMEEEHKRNAARLKEIIAEHGWPGRSLVGEDGMIAAWFIAQHAIGNPLFQRQALKLMKAALRKGEVSALAVAFLEDRIRVCEGHPQIYGTQFELDEHGIYRPFHTIDPERVNERRKAVGIEALEERTAVQTSGPKKLQLGNTPDTRRTIKIGCAKPAGANRKCWNSRNQPAREEQRDSNDPA